MTIALLKTRLQLASDHQKREQKPRDENHENSSSDSLVLSFADRVPAAPNPGRQLGRR